jgi:hypothetical protein
MFTGDALLNGPDMMLCGPDAGMPAHFWIGPGAGQVGGTSFLGSISGNVLTVIRGAPGASGSVLAGQAFTSPNVPAYTAITRQTSGTPGGAGQYTINKTLAVALPAQIITTGNSYLTGQNCNQVGYNAWNLFPLDANRTPIYGMVPLVLTEWNKNNHTGVWRVADEWYQGWGGNSFGGSALTSTLQAQTTVYAAEKARTFVGANIAADRIHIENSLPWQLVDSYSAIQTASPTVIRNVYLNSDPSCATCSQSQFYATQSFPFIQIPYFGGSITLENICCNITGGNGSDTLLIDFASSAGSNTESSPSAQDQGQLTVHGGQLGRLSFRYPANSNGRNNMANTYGGYGSPAFGAGSFDISPWTAFTNNGVTGTGGNQISPGNTDALNRYQGFNASPYFGTRPAMWSQPCIAPSQWASLLNPTGNPPAISVSGTQFSAVWSVPYPLLFAGQQYKICDWQLTANAFNAGINYPLGALVTSGGNEYMSIQSGNLGNTPPNASFWYPFHYGFVTNSGVGFSYGQNIGTALMGSAFTWQNISNSPAIAVPELTNANSLGLFFPGQQLNLTGTQTGCTSQETFIIREVHFDLGYMMVFRTDSDGGGTMIPAWTPTTPFLCSNNIIGQAPYAFTNLN